MAQYQFTGTSTTVFVNVQLMDGSTLMAEPNGIYDVQGNPDYPLLTPLTAPAAAPADTPPIAADTPANDEPAPTDATTN
jgi:hypothetical protein